MIAFLINVFRLIRAIVIGLRKDHEFRILLFLLVTLLAGSTTFYTWHESWSVMNSLYFSVVTMSTIGYGDLTPTTVYSKGFTIVFTFLSTGVFVALNAKLVILIINRKR